MNESTSETRDLEEALAALRPSAEPMDRDRLMFLAGRAIAEREMAQYTAEPGVAAGIVGLGLAGQGLPGRGGMLSQCLSNQWRLSNQWLWPSATAVATVAASVLGLLLAISHHPLVIREKVYVHAEPTIPGVPTTSRNAGQTDLPVTARGEGLAGGPAAPGTLFPAGMQGILHVPVYSTPDPPVSRQDSSIARIDFAPRTSLPPSNYVRNRQVALSLGVEALGSWTPSGGDELPVAYRERLDGMLSGTESP